MQGLPGAIIVSCCWPFKIVLECAISSDSERCQKSQNRQGYSLGKILDFGSILKGPINRECEVYQGDNSLMLLAFQNSTRMCDFVRFREVSEISK